MSRAQVAVWTHQHVEGRPCKKEECGCRVSQRVVEQVEAHRKGGLLARVTIRGKSYLAVRERMDEPFVVNVYVTQKEGA